MERAIVFGIEKFATHDGPGIRTVVFLKGCPLRCMWCHSPESWNFEVERYPDGEVIGQEMSSDGVLAEVLKDKDFYDASGGGLTVSGGEPLARPAFLAELLGKAKAAALHTAVETSGAATEKVFAPLLPLVDLWLWDVKELDAEKHFAYTKRQLAPILANLRRVNDALAAAPARKRSIVLRCPMIPGVNDGAKEIEAIGRLADSVRRHRRARGTVYPLRHRQGAPLGAEGLRGAATTARIRSADRCRADPPYRQAGAPAVGGMDTKRNRSSRGLESGGDVVPIRCDAVHRSRFQAD